MGRKRETSSVQMRTDVRMGAKLSRLPWGIAVGRCEVSVLHEPPRTDCLPAASKKLAGIHSNANVRTHVREKNSSSECQAQPQMQLSGSVQD